MLIVIVLVSVSTFVMLTNVETDGSSAQVTSNGQCGTNATYNIYSDGILEIAGSGEMDQYDTTHAPWYECRENITKIVISDKITKLGTYAFLDCKNVTELIMPITLNSVVSDKYSAFAGCCNIEKINLTCGNGGYGYNYAAYKGSGSWYQNTPWYQSRGVLEEINFADDVKGIGSDAFRELNITSLVLPDSVVHLGNHSFLNCTKLTDLTIPISLNSCGSDEDYPAFKGCMAVQKVIFTKGNSIPYDYTVWRSLHKPELAPWNMNSGIAKTIIVSDDVTKLGDYMFWYTNIKELTIPISCNAVNDKSNSSIQCFWIEKINFTLGSGFGYDYETAIDSENWYKLTLWYQSRYVLYQINFAEGIKHIGDNAFDVKFYDTDGEKELEHTGEILAGYTFNNIDGNWIIQDPSKKFDKCGEDLTYQLDHSTGALTIRGSGRMGSNSSGDAPWYSNKDIITSVTITGFVTTIGDYAFYGCGSLSSVTIPDSVTSIGYYAFAECTSLTTINLGKSINSIRSNAFSGCISLNSIVLPDSVTHLGAQAFLYCKNITELTMPIILNTVASDKCPIFSGCCNIQKINFTPGNGGYGHNYAAYPGSGSYYQYTPWYQSKDTLKEINFADGITNIGNDAFRELNITSVALPETVTRLGNHCFYNCTKLTDLTIPISLNSYGNETYPAFKGCRAVQNVSFTKGNGIPYDYSDTYVLAPWNINSDLAKTIVISNNITRLGGYMFWYCNLKELTVPLSINFTKCNAFDGLNGYTNLEKVIITGGTGEAYDYDTRTGRGFADAHKTLCPWNNAPNLGIIIVDEGVTHIGDYTFCCDVEKLTLPSTLASFGKRAFNHCDIKDLTIPISLNATWLDDYVAFENVSGIEKIIFTPGSGYGFNYAAYKDMNCWYQHTPWYQCKDTLKEINFAEGIKHIGSDAFRDLYITSLVIPNSVESLGSHTFYNLTNLTSLTIPATLDSVGSNKYPAFQSCVNIENMTFTGTGNWFEYSYSDSEPSYFRYAPWQLSKTALKTVEISNGVTSVGKLALEGCTYLTTIDLGRSIDSLGDRAFKDCTSLRSITIPGSVTSIGENVFDGKFYDTFEFEIDQTVENLADSIFNHIGYKWVKQDPSKKSGKCGDNITYEFDFSTGTLAINGFGQMESYSRGEAPWHTYRNFITSITIADSITSIGDFAFEDIAYIDSITIPDSVTSIGVSAFEGCASLISIVFPHSVTTIGSHACSGCDALTFVSIPLSVTNISDSAFDGKFYGHKIVNSGNKCRFGLIELTQIADLAGSTFKNVDGNWINYVSDAGPCGDYVPNDEIRHWSNTEYPNGTFYRLKLMVYYEYDAITKTLKIHGLGAIRDFTYYSMPWISYKESIKNVIIDDSITSIGANAFSGCTSLTSLTLGKSITTIGDNAFEGKFYNEQGETELEVMAEILAGSTFNKIDGKWIKQGSALFPTPSLSTSDSNSIAD